MRNPEISEKKGITLVREPDFFPNVGRFLADEIQSEGRKVTEPRRKIYVEGRNDVAEVRTGCYSHGILDYKGLKYLKTEPLGACIALTLWHPELKTAFLAHFIVRTQAKEGLKKVFDEMREIGLKPSEFEAKLFGGGSIKSNDNIPYSQQLVWEIWEELVREEISLSEKDLYGWGKRCIVLKLESGEVFDYPTPEQRSLDEDYEEAPDQLIVNRELP